MQESQSHGEHVAGSGVLVRVKGGRENHALATSVPQLAVAAIATPKLFRHVPEADIDFNRSSEHWLRMGHALSFGQDQTTVRGRRNRCKGDALAVSDRMFPLRSTHHAVRTMVWSARA